MSGASDKIQLGALAGVFALEQTAPNQKTQKNQKSKK
jgi:hypothetical protein